MFRSLKRLASGTPTIAELENARDYNGLIRAIDETLGGDADDLWVSGKALRNLHEPKSVDGLVKVIISHCQKAYAYDEKAKAIEAEYAGNVQQVLGYRNVMFNGPSPATEPRRMASHHRRICSTASDCLASAKSPEAVARYLKRGDLASDRRRYNSEIRDYLQRALGES